MRGHREAVGKPLFALRGGVHANDAERLVGVRDRDGATAFGRARDHAGTAVAERDSERLGQLGGSSHLFGGTFDLGLFVGLVVEWGFGWFHLPLMPDANHDLPLGYERPHTP